MKFEFDNLEEYKEAMKDLEDYHDCEKSHGKIIGIHLDFLGQTHCGYCGKVVKYPRLKGEVFDKMLLEEKGK
jgi:hypothetical protein